MTALLRQEEGFTLLEVMVALTLFAIGLLGIAGLQVTAIRQNSTASNRSVSVALAQAVVEEVLAMDEKHPDFQANNLNVVWPGDLQIDPNIPGAESYSATFSVLTDNPVNLVARVTVTINAPGGRTTSLTCFKRFIR